MRSELNSRSQYGPARDVELKNFDKAFDYEKSPYYIFAAGKGSYARVYGQDSNDNVYTLDYTFAEPQWIKKGNLGVDAVRGVLTDSQVLVVYCNDKTIKRSTDAGFTFTTVDTNVGMLGSGMDCNGETIMYAEYTVTGTSTLRVRRSTDGGQTWTTVLTQDRPTVIDHFHTVVYLREHARWYVTSGDFQTACKWWKSDDNGATLVLVAENDFRLRTCGVTGGIGNALIWSSDNGATPFIFAGNKNKPLVDARIIGTLQGHSLGIVGARNLLMTSYRVETALDPTGLLWSEILVSGDAGASWQTEFRITGTHFFFLQPIYNGHVFIQNETRESWIAKPRHAYRHTPINQGYFDMPFLMAPISGLALRTTTEVLSAEGLPFDIFNPQLEVSNFLDQSVTVKFESGGAYRGKADGSLFQFTVTGGKSAMINLTELTALPKDTKISITATVAPTGGSVTTRIRGMARRPNDHRVMALETY